VFSVKQGDTEPPLQVLLKDSNGRAVVVNDGDLVTFRMAPVSASVGVIVNEAATVNDPLVGDVQYDWPGGAPSPGLYRAEFHLARLAGDELTFPGDGYIDVKVDPALV
jgi:hypothetical protein